MTLQSDVDVVVGIWIGTNYTSIAYNFSNDETSFPSPLWHDPFIGRMSSKLPTIAVYSADKVFQAFGYEALKQIEEQKSGDLLVFSNFVKDIFCSGIDVPKYVLAENGSMVPSLDLLSSVISCLFRNGSLSEMGSLMKRYVFTIPLWACDSHEQFLESAARNAGLHDGQVVVVPEAVSIFYIYRQNHRMDHDGKEIDPFIVGKQNVVVECEDDNVSITILRLQEDESIEIIYNSFENEMALSQVQHDFDDLITGIFGKSVFDDFCRENISDYYYLLHTLHYKMTLTPAEKITFSLPAGLIVLFKKKTGKQIEKAIEKTNLANKISIHHGKCKIDFDVFRTLFIDAGRNVVQLLHNLFARIEPKEKVNIILAGQFSNSIIFQETIRHAFSDHYIIAEGDHIVTKGAAMYGHRPVKLNMKERYESYTSAQVAIRVPRRKKGRKKRPCSIL